MMPLPPPPEARVAQLAPPCSTFTRKSGWDSLESGKGSKWVGILDDITFSLPRTPDVFKEMEDDPFVRVWLPPKNSTSGRVLDHAKRVIESTDYRFAPMSFKIGFTHDPSFRFHNPTFGYKKDKYQQMIVLFAHHNPEVAAYLEAALIALHDGSLFGIYHIVPSILIFWHISYIYIYNIYISCMLICYRYIYTFLHPCICSIYFGFPDVTSNPFPSSRCLRKAGVPEWEAWRRRGQAGFCLERAILCLSGIPQFQDTSYAPKACGNCRRLGHINFWKYGEESGSRQGNWKQMTSRGHAGKEHFRFRMRSKQVHTDTHLHKHTYKHIYVYIYK